MKKRGRPQKSEDEIKKQKEDSLWKNSCLDTQILEEYKLLNENYPQTKQVFIKEQSLIKRFTQSKIRYVKKMENKVPLIDCRTTRINQFRRDANKTNKQIQLLNTNSEGNNIEEEEILNQCIEDDQSISQPRTIQQQHYPLYFIENSLSPNKNTPSPNRNENVSIKTNLPNIKKKSVRVMKKNTKNIIISTKSQKINKQNVQKNNINENKQQSVIIIESEESLILVEKQKKQISNDSKRIKNQQFQNKQQILCDSFISSQNSGDFKNKKEIHYQTEIVKNIIPHSQVVEQQNQLQIKQLPAYLLYQACESSLSLSQVDPISKSMAAKFMQDDIDSSDIFNESISSVNNFQIQKQQIFQEFSHKFKDFNEQQFEYILQAYHHNLEQVIKIFQQNEKQIEILIKKYKQQFQKSERKK